MLPLRLNVMFSHSCLFSIRVFVAWESGHQIVGGWFASGPVPTTPVASWATLLKKWVLSLWQTGYITPAILGSPTADRTKSDYATPAVSRSPQAEGTKGGGITPTISESAKAEGTKSGYIDPCRTLIRQGSM